jgi:hypothetical protein
MSRLRLRGAEKASPIEGEKQPVFVYSSETIAHVGGEFTHSPVLATSDIRSKTREETAI